VHAGLATSSLMNLTEIEKLSEDDQDIIKKVIEGFLRSLRSLLPAVQEKVLFSKVASQDIDAEEPVSKIYGKRSLNLTGFKEEVRVQDCLSWRYEKVE